MDFRYHFSAEQEQFRQEVQSWILTNLPRESASRITSTATGPDNPESSPSILALLGPHGSTEASVTRGPESGGLDRDLAVVLMQELERHGLLWLARQSTGLLQAITDYGAADQHGMFLSALTMGELVCWTPSHSSDGAVDPARTPVEAMRDGDDYILDGTDLFLGLGDSPDYLWAPAVSDPEGPSPVVSVFLVAANLLGVSVSTPRRLTSSQQHRVAFENVRVPSYCLLGREGDGWVLNSLLHASEMDPLPPAPNDPRVDQLLKYAGETVRDGETLAGEPNRQQLLMEAYIDSRVSFLFRTRDAWMRETGQNLTYHVAQTRQWERRTSERLAGVSRSVMGMYAMLDPDDPRAPSQGSFEYLQLLGVAGEPPESAVAGDAALIANALGLAGPPLEAVGDTQPWDQDQTGEHTQPIAELSSPAR